MTDIEIHHINYNSKHHGKCKFAFKLIRFLNVSNLFTLEVVQKCQHCQLCVLWENSHTYNELGRGGAGTHAPPTPICQNFLIFMQFLGLIGQIVGYPNRRKTLDPPLPMTFYSKVSPQGRIQDPPWGHQHTMLENVLKNCRRIPMETR